MSPSNRDAKKHAKARQRHRRTAQERLTRDRRQAQHAADMSETYTRVRALRIFTNDLQRSSSIVRPLFSTASSSVTAPQFIARRK